MQFPHGCILRRGEVLRVVLHGTGLRRSPLLGDAADRLKSSPRGRIRRGGVCSTPAEPIAGESPSLAALLRLILLVVTAANEAGTVVACDALKLLVVLSPRVMVTRGPSNVDSRLRPKCPKESDGSHLHFLVK